MNSFFGNSYREGIMSLKSSPGGQSLSFNTIGSPSSVLRRPIVKYYQALVFNSLCNSKCKGPTAAKPNYRVNINLRHDFVSLC